MQLMMDTFGPKPINYLSVPKWNKSEMADWDWDKIIWKKVRKVVFSLQKRIYKASKAGKFR